MKRAFIALTMLVVITSATILQAATLSTIAAPQTNPNALNVTGTLANGTFTGVFDITRFAVKNGGVVAIGRLVGTITQTIGDVTTTIPVNQLVTLPVTPGAASCEILNLQIGAISLDLLGLVVNLAPIDLVITAEPGPGNLLGNLLCAVAGLLDGNGNAFGRLAGLLNDILRILG
jgi:hypothetical protein